MRLLPLLGLTALITTTPILGEALWMDGLQSSLPAIAQTPAPSKAQVQLELAAAKQVITKNSKGESVVSWQPLGAQASVNPGDVLRYTVTGKNVSDRPAKNLVILQPIPKQTVYSLNSASFGQGAGTITFSIDRGKTFVAKPLVQVKLNNGSVETRPAPATFYTHVRWQFAQPINPKQTVTSIYEVKVR